MAQTRYIQDVLKREVHPIFLGLSLVLFFVVSAAVLNNLYNQVIAQYDGIIQVANKVPKNRKSQPPPNITQSNANTNTPDKRVGDGPATTRNTKPPSNISPNSGSNPATAQQPATQSTSQQNQRETKTESSDPFFCVAGVCI